MRRFLKIIPGFALLSVAASAQSTSAPGQYPGLAALSSYVQQGLSIALISAQGQLVAVVNADGTVTVARGADLGEAAIAIVRAERGGVLATLRLVGNIKSGDTILVEQSTGGGTRTVPITSSTAFQNALSAEVNARNPGRAPQAPRRSQGDTRGGGTSAQDEAERPDEKDTDRGGAQDRRGRPDRPGGRSEDRPADPPGPPSRR